MCKNISKRYIFIFILIVFSLILNSHDVFARGGGGGVSGDSGLGFGLSVTSTDQKDVNAVATANSAKELPSAYEFLAQYEFRFTRTMFAMLFRPSYFSQESSKTCSSTTCNYKMTGYTVFPVFRLYPLENSFIKFYMQAGIGYGSLSADITNSTGTLKFSGGNLGYMGGIGVNFCFTDSHCLVVEGNVRYLPIFRNTAESATGTHSGLNQASTGMEVEDANSNDLATSMSGIQGVIGYQMNF